MQAGFLRVDECDEEGVVVKALSAPYHLGTQPRAEATWLKWKRDYAAEAWEADVLVVGGMWGRAGERAGITRYVFALRASPDSARPFITFGRVHAGVTVRVAVCANLRECRACLHLVQKGAGGV